jgi:hypothetical protein
MQKKKQIKKAASRSQPAKKKMMISPGQLSFLAAIFEVFSAPVK